MLDDTLRLLFLLLLGLIAAWGALIVYTYRALTSPPRRTYASALARGRPGDPSQLPPSPRTPGTQRIFEAWTFPSSAGPLHVWDMPGDDPDGPVVVMCHGWGDSRIGALTRAPGLLPSCSRLVMWDMPGHGESPGRCALGLRETDHLLDLFTHVADQRPLVLFGWSLGAGVAIAAAVRAPRRIRAVIAESPYRLAHTPAHNVLTLMGIPHRPNLRPALWLVRWLSGKGANFDGFDRAALAKHLSCPLLVIHGEQDNVSPVADARDIAHAAPDATILCLPEAGHHGLWTDPATLETCGNAVRKLLARVRATPASPVSS